MKRFLLPLLSLLALLSSSHSAHAGEDVSDVGERRAEWWGSAEVRPIGEVGGEWTELVVDLRPTSVVHGRLELLEVERNESGRVVDRREVELTPSVPRRIHVPARGDRSYFMHLVDDHDARLWQQSVTLQGARGTTVLAMDVDAPAFALHQNEARPTSLLAMPQAAWTYDGALLFFVHGAILADIEPLACAPLVSWIRDGGSLVVAETTTADALEILDRRCQLGDRRSFVSTSTQLGTAVRIGNGLVSAVPAKLLTSDARALDELYSDATRRHTGWLPNDRRSFVPRVDHSLRLVAAGGVILLFGVVAGPMLFLRLRRRKVASVHGLLAVASVTALGGMLLLGRAFAPRAHVTKTALREFTTGQMDGRATTTRVFHGPSGVVRTKPLRADALLGGGSRGTRGDFRLERDGTVVLNEKIPSVSDYVCLIESTLDRLPGPITLECSGAVCTIDNATGAPLERVRLNVSSYGVFDVGTIHDRTTVHLSTSAHASHDESPDEHFLTTSGARVSLVARQGADPDTVIAVTCPSCEVSP